MPDDRPVILDIISRIDNKNLCDFMIEIYLQMNTYEKLRNVKFLSDTKLIQQFLLLATGTPLIGIAYHPKTEEFMKQFSVSFYCVVDKNLSSEILMNKLDNIESELDQVGVSLFSKARVLSDKFWEI